MVFLRLYLPRLLTRPLTVISSLTFIKLWLIRQTTCSLQSRDLNNKIKTIATAAAATRFLKAAVATTRILKAAAETTRIPKAAEATTKISKAAAATTRILKQQ